MKRKTFIGKFILSCTNYLFLIIILATAAIVNAQSGGEKNILKFQDLQLKASTEGKIRVIVKLDVQDIHKLQDRSRQFKTPAPGFSGVWGGASADQALSDQIANTAESVKMGLAGTNYRVFRVYKSIPYMAMEVTSEALSALELIPEVVDIAEDKAMPLSDPVPTEKMKGNGEAPTPSGLERHTLNNTVNIVGASNAWSMGYTGSGWYVAILDTGIRKTHEMFTGKTIAEACYAQGQTSGDAAGDCPNGLTTMIGPGAAAHYSSTADAAYDHGTHVAGIATGHSATLSGIAKDANIIAVQVFSKFDATACGGSPCVMSYNSDCLAGLDYVYSIRGSYSIAAVNMSLGGGQYYDAASCDAAQAARKTAIDNLRSAGIASAISSGNNGYCDSMGAPGCISTAVSVGASDDADVEPWFNNWHPTMLKLFAPGVSINSSVGDSDTSYESWNGTSMAAPHVAGAWALIKQAVPDGSVTDILAALQTTGFGIFSECDSNTVAIPRIQVDAAINLLKPSRTPNDFNNDGKTDLVWRDATTGDNALWLMTAATYPTTYPDVAFLPNVTGTSWQIAAIGDFNADGMTDLVWRDTTSGTNALWLMNSATTYSAITFLPAVAGTNWQIAGTGDFNADGMTDILWRDSTTGTNAMWLMTAVTYPTTYPNPVFLPQVTDTNWQIVGTGDFNNDGKDDVVWRNATTGDNALWLMNGGITGIQSYPDVVTLPQVAGSNWQIVGTGDFNNDGKDDLVWSDTTGGSNAMWLMNGTANPGVAFLPAVTDPNWQIVTTGDFNNDGKDDLVWSDASSGNYAMWLMTATTYPTTYPDVTFLPAVTDPNWQIVGFK